MTISKTVYNALLNEWGPQSWWLATSSLEMIIGAILTQNTSWTQLEKTIEKLKDVNALKMEILASIPSVKIGIMDTFHRLSSPKSIRYKTNVQQIDQNV
jgi:endonuclease-3 related protein